MLELFLPYYIALALGMEPDAQARATVALPPGGVEPAPEATGDNSATVIVGGNVALGETVEIGGQTGTDAGTIAVGEDGLAGGEGIGEVETVEPAPQVATGRYTTAVEVRPILDATRGNWVAVRNYEGRDLVYFTHLLSWRCGLRELRYGLNGAAPTEVFLMEPCNEEFAQPNAMVDVETFLPYLEQPPESVQSVTVEIVYDDGSTDMLSATRGDLLIP